MLNYLYVLLSAAFLGATFVASKRAMQELTPLGFTTVWFSVASVWGLLYYFFQRERITPAQVRQAWWPLFLLGLSSSLSNLFFFNAIHLGDQTVVAFLSRSETLFSLLLGMTLLHERLNGWQWAGAATTLIGAGLLTYQGGAIIWPVALLTLVGNFFNAFASYTAKQSVASLPPVLMNFARTVGQAVILGSLAGLTGGLAWPSPIVWVWIIGGSFFGPFLSFIFFYHGLKGVGIGTASIIRSTQPLFVAVYSLILFGQMMNGAQFLGGFVILAGVVLMLRQRELPEMK